MLPLVIDGVLIGAALVLAIPCGVFFFECLVAVVGGTIRPASSEDTPQPKSVVLVPSHDESVVIAETLEGLRGEMGSEDRIVVIADNCTDDTAEIARRVGVEVIERTNADERGKGYAIAFGLETLSDAPPDVVMIVDADCAVEPGALMLIAREAMATGRPVQAEYLLTNAADDVKSLVSALAFLVRNRVRPRGLARLGLPAHLTGSGMAFPWAVIQNAPSTGSYLVEDLLMGIEMALQGRPPRLCPSAQVTSLLPEEDRAAMGQRRRWEHGQLVTLTKHAPRLIGAGIARFDLGLLAMGMDLLVPPLALLVLMCGGLFAAASVSLFVFERPWAVGAAAMNLAMVSFGVAAAWARYGRNTIPLAKLAFVPLYVLWKVPLYLSLVFRGRQKTWERTERAKK